MGAEREGVKMTEDEMREWIDKASYEELLGKWRRAPGGDPFFIGEIGDHFVKTMKAKCYAVGNAEAVQASKNVGWQP